MRAGFDDVDLDRLRRRRTIKWTLYGPEVLAAWVAELDFDVAPVVRRAIADAVDREDFGYTPPVDELIGAATSFFEARYGWAVSPARVFPVADVVTGVGIALDTFVEPGAGVVLPTPAYPPLFEVIELTGRPVVPVPTLDVDAVDAALGAGARAVLLTNPHNPTGRAFTTEELGGLAAVVEHHGARVIADEVHAPLVYPGARHTPYAAVSDATADHAITVTSASKAFNLAGLKCAQVIATNHADAARWRQLRLLEVPGPTPLGVAASVAAYGAGQSWLDDLVDYLDGNRRVLGELLAEEVPQIGYSVPDASFLAWLDCTALGIDDPARFFLEQARVALNDGPPFGPGCDQYVRLNFATSRRLLGEIVAAMGAAVRDGVRS